MSSLLRRAQEGSWLGFAAIALIFPSGRCLAQTDEIQVYDAEIAGKGAVNLMVHSNFTVSGLTAPAFAGAVVSNHAFVGVAEWAFGVTSWFEQGLYLPLYSDSTNLGGTYNGFKIRELFVKPHAEKQTFFYGVNFEFSVNQPQWNARHYSSEVRPIIGWHFKPPDSARWKQIDLIVNPIVDTDWRGGFRSLDFAPSERIAYNVNEAWQVAVEEYADFGQFRNIPGVDGQFHQVWAVADHKSEKWVNLEMGIGFGLTSASDKVTLKLMISRDVKSASTPPLKGSRGPAWQ